MSLLEAVRDHLTATITDLDSEVQKHKDLLAEVEAAIAAPVSIEDVRALLDRVPRA